MTTTVTALAAGTVAAMATPSLASTPAASSPTGVASLTLASTDKYANAIDATNRRGMRVWVETDLVKQWSAGTTSFNATVARVAALASRPGVVGIKIADEMGYRDSLTSSTQIQQFLKDSSVALRKAAPGKLLLIDLLVPQMGCLPGLAKPTVDTIYCNKSLAAKYPQLTLDKVDGYLKSGTLDVVDLSTYMRDDVGYKKWGFTANEAQTYAWNEANHRGWNTAVQLRGRKAIAHAGIYQGTDATANATLVTYSDIPVSRGAHGVDMWAWRQLYTGEIYRLMDPGNTTNALWKGLQARHASGVQMSTHLSPSSVEQGLDKDLDIIATVFTDLFVAAGTG